MPLICTQKFGNKLAVLILHGQVQILPNAAPLIRASMETACAGELAGVLEDMGNFSRRVTSAINYLLWGSVKNPHIE